ncbi:quinol:cytochrome C oxidoreductase [Limibacter armeniacum]|uniref:quinol:cytochrome C oxidoreductase n=1 Tax=Limibacter armeniacum TaxID=466084 RepID=UPI002FE5FB75
MDEHTHTPVDVKENFVLTPALKGLIARLAIIGGIVTVVGLIIILLGGVEGIFHTGGHDAAHGAAGSHGGEHAGEHHAVFHWTDIIKSNLWTNTVFFLGMSLLGFFFFAVQYAANSGWSVPIVRVMMAFGRYVPIMGILLFLIFLWGNHQIFHWTHGYLYEKGNPDFDPILYNKRGFLNIPFYLIRMVFFVGVWTLFWWMLNKITVNEDQHIDSVVHFRRSQRISVAFLIFFGVSESIASWDWIMSIDPHWFSTLFGWYCLSSWLVAALCAMTFITIMLQQRGYLKIVNENHLHDLGKYIFGFSIFWSYLFISQFLLIYYANMPEETIYFVDRLGNPDYKGLFFFMLFLNFLFPLLALMTRDAKRKKTFLKVICPIVFIGHWLDFYLLITPGTLKSMGGMSLFAVGVGLVFLAGFAFTVFKGLTKHSLIPVNHPLLDEAINHHT